MSVTAQWTLNQTVGDLVGISRGMLAAATSDNVQMLALLACEGFGATLAISPEACHKVQLLCGQSSEPAVVTFLKAQIGYRIGDCGWQLAQNEAGVRFLGLTACLTTIGHWVAAEALHAMIIETATDKTLVPSSIQLKRLIQVLECRLTKSGFMESVLGWSIWIRNHSALDRTDMLPGDRWDIEPTRAVLMQLVKATRGFGRIGELSKSKMFIISSSGEAPWIIAFLKWCLGAPPSIVLQDGTAILSEPNSATILKIDDTRGQAQISTVDEIGEVTELVDLAHGSITFRGMVDARIYAQKLLNDLFGRKDHPFRRACEEALPYACTLVLAKLRPSSLTPSDRHSRRDTDEFDSYFTTKHISATWGGVFRGNEKIESVLGLFLDPDVSPALRELLPGTLVQDLPMVAIARDLISRSCPCTNCKNETRAPKRKCNSDLFLCKIGTCVAVILALSMVDSRDPDGVQVLFSGPISDRRTCFDIFVGETNSIISNGHPTFCDPSVITGSALQLLGHETKGDRHDRWIMSSCYGQTVYPQLLETEKIVRDGILTMVCVPGVLMWKGQPYARVESSALHSYPMSESESSEEEAVEEATERPEEIRCPSDAFTRCRTSWHVGIGENRLTLSILSSGFSSTPIRDPMKAIRAAALSLFVDCDHDQMTKLSIPQHLLSATTPVRPEPPRSRSAVVGVVQCRGNERMRFFTLTAGIPGVIRGDACLQCCIDSCRLDRSTFVIC